MITHPAFIAGEIEALEALLAAGNGRLHVRKPGATDQELFEFMTRIAACLDMKRVTIHHNREMFASFGCGGFHGRDVKDVFKLPGTLLSTPVHTTFEAKMLNNSDVDYVLMSPVFNSISKQGHISPFDRDMLTDFLYENRFSFKMVALGGISHHNIAETKAMGFDTVALLGALWQNYRGEQDIAALVKHYKTIDRLWRK